MSEYVLGTDLNELDRLAFQQTVWGDITERLLDTLAIRPGARVADLGCGPGLLLPSWRERVGESGEVVLVDEAERWHEHLERQLDPLPANVRLIRSRLEDLQLEEASYDVLFARWVFGFIAEAPELIAKLARALKPGGVFAVQDYNHEGISVFPASEGFRAMVRGLREMYTETGGDTWLGGRLPQVFADAGLEAIGMRPNVLAGGPGSGVFQWADLFFPRHSENMLERGVVTAEERELFLREWAALKANPNGLFFSPIVVSCWGRKKGSA